MWGGGGWLGKWDGKSVQQEELEQICRYETDVRETMAAFVSSGVTPFEMIRAVSDGVVDAAREIGMSIVLNLLHKVWREE
jgi:hypothetical protein